MRALILYILMASPLLLGAQATEGQLLGQWSDNSLIGSVLYNNTYNEIWGVARNGHEYAVIGSTAGTHFIEVTNPALAEEKFFIPGGSQGGVIIHRDYHDYGCYLYMVADEGSKSTLQIVDLSQLPDAIELVYDSGEELQKSHNIFIDQDRAKMYCLAAVGGPQSYTAMRIYDLADPLDLKFLGSYDNFGGLQVSHVHDAFVKNDTAYLHCGPHGFAIVDFSDPANPNTLSTLTEYPGAGYNHSGWLSEDGRYYYMADETWGSDIKIIDLLDPSEPEVIGTFNAGSNHRLSIPHNQIVACDYLYVSYYYDGLQVYDISDPTQPMRHLFYDTSNRPYDNSYEGAWGIYPFLPSGNILLSDMQEGLFIFAGPGDQCENRVEIDCQLSSSQEISFEGKIQLFPQPSSGPLNAVISVDAAYDDVRLELLDITGRQVQLLPKLMLFPGENRIQFDLFKHPPGIYFLKFQHDRFQAVRKIILQD